MTVSARRVGKAFFPLPCGRDKSRGVMKTICHDYFPWSNLPMAYWKGYLSNCKKYVSQRTLAI
jgi:hypothetical protein